LKEDPTREFQGAQNEKKGQEDKRKVKELKETSLTVSSLSQWLAVLFLS